MREAEGGSGAEGLGGASSSGAGQPSAAAVRAAEMEAAGGAGGMVETERDMMIRKVASFSHSGDRTSRKV